MARSLLPIVTILATATALVLSAAAVVLQSPPEIPMYATGPAVDAHSASRAVVERFYDAVNYGIATGKVESLDAVLAPSYAEGNGTDKTISGREQMAEVVLNLHETTPSLRLTADPIIVDGARAVATVHTSGLETAQFLGLPLTAPSLWGPTDVFRISENRVIERLPAIGGRVMLESLVRVPISLKTTAARNVSATRLVLPPDGERMGIYLGHVRLLYVESGELAVAIAETRNVHGQIGPPATPTGADTMSAGESIVLTDGAAYHARNDSGEPAVFLEFSAAPIAPGRAASYEVPRLDNLGLGAQSRVVAPHSGITTAAGPAVVSIGRANLEPGAQLVWEGAPGPTMLLIPAGTVGLRANGGEVWTRRGGDSNRDGYDRSVLVEGDGTLVSQGTSATLSNLDNEPVAILVITLIGE